MAVCYITEFAEQPVLAGGHSLPVGMQPAVAEQVVAITTNTQSSAFNAKTAFVRIHVDAICSIEFGTNPTASTTTARMAANSTEYFAVPKGLSYKVAVITNS